MAWVAREETFVSLFSISTAVLDIYSRASSLIQNLMKTEDKAAWLSILVILSRM